MIHAYRGKSPAIHADAFVADSSDIIGDVSIGKESSIWFRAVVRGDVNSIAIGERTNIQDGCILHVRHGTYPLLVGSDVTVAHGAILHACTIEDKCLIGMGAIVLDNARIRHYTLVAAGALVRQETTFPEGVLIAGLPARVIRELTQDERSMIDESALNYVEYARDYRLASD